jgi:hypothetical protein
MKRSTSRMTIPVSYTVAFALAANWLVAPDAYG